MPTKTVTIETVLGEKFKIESKIGKHTVYVDQPEAMGGTDAGPNPLQYFLLSLAGCISSIARIIAMQKRIPFRSMKLTVKGDLNTDVLLGCKNKDNRAGFNGIEVEADIDADMPQSEKESFIKEVDSRCPVSDNILNTAPISIKLKE